MFREVKKQSPAPNVDKHIAAISECIAAFKSSNRVKAPEQIAAIRIQTPLGALQDRLATLCKMKEGQAIRPYDHEFLMQSDDSTLRNDPSIRDYNNFLPFTAGKIPSINKHIQGISSELNDLVTNPKKAMEEGHLSAKKYEKVKKEQSRRLATLHEMKTGAAISSNEYKLLIQIGVFRNDPGIHGYGNIISTVDMHLQKLSQSITETQTTIRSFEKTLCTQENLHAALNKIKNHEAISEDEHALLMKEETLKNEPSIRDYSNIDHPTFTV